MALGGCTGSARVHVSKPPPPPESVTTAPEQVRPDEAFELPTHPNDLSGRTFAILRLGADLRRTPDLSAIATAYLDDEGPHVVEVLERNHEWVAIETVEHLGGRHCARALGDGLSLRSYVQESDLLSVVATTITHVDEAGGYVLAPGNIVHEDERGWYVEGLDSVWKAPFAPNNDDSGEHGGLRPVPNTAAARFDLAATAQAQVDKVYAAAPLESAPVPVAVSYRDGYLRVQNRGIVLWPLRVYAHRESETGSLVLAGTSCIQIFGAVLHDPRLPFLTGSGGGPSCRSMSLSDPLYEIAPDTEIHWQAKGFAGRTTSTWRTTETATRTRGGLLCFHPILGCSRSEDLRICVPAGAVDMRVQHPWSERLSQTH